MELNSTIATVSITVNPPEQPKIVQTPTVETINHPPTADSFSITTNSTTPKDISFVDSVHDDLDRGDTSTTNVVSQPSDGQGKVININPEEGTATYDPQGFAGETHFTYKATDNHGANSTIATVSITVNPPEQPKIVQTPTVETINHPPTADSFSITTNSTTPKDISFVDSVHDDLDRGDTSTTNVVSQPSDGQGKVININPEEGTATYDPQGFAGETHFTYKATDNHGVNSTIATVSITVNPPEQPKIVQTPTVETINHPPTADNFSITTNSTTPKDISFVDSVHDDLDRGDTSTTNVVSQPSDGQGKVININPEEGTATYDPQGFAGETHFTYKATDNHGANSTIATVSITVNPPEQPKIVQTPTVETINHPPTADSFSITTNSTTPKDISFVDSVHDDLDRGDTSTTNVVSQPSDGQGKVININPEEGTATYDPQGFAGETHFTYKATDNHGAE